MENEKQLDVIDRKALLKTLDRYINPMPDKEGYHFLCGLSTAITEIEDAHTVDAVEVVHGRWEDGICSNCKKEALSTSWDEPIYDYDWEENLRYSYTETHTEHILTDYCPNCGAKMDGGNEDGVDD